MQCLTSLRGQFETHPVKSTSSHHTVKSTARQMFVSLLSCGGKTTACDKGDSCRNRDHRITLNLAQCDYTTKITSVFRKERMKMQVKYRWNCAHVCKHIWKLEMLLKLSQVYSLVQPPSPPSPLLSLSEPASYRNTPSLIWVLAPSILSSAQFQARHWPAPMPRAGECSSLAEG